MKGSMRKKRSKNLTKDKVKIICDHLRKGASYNASANAAGLNQNTFNGWYLTGEKESQWRDKGRKRNPELDDYVYLYKQVIKALAETETKLSNTIIQSSQKDSDGDWKAAAWMLERRFNWKNKTEVETTVKNINPKDQLKEKLGLIEERIEHAEREVTSDENS